MSAQLLLTRVSRGDVNLLVSNQRQSLSVSQDALLRRLIRAASVGAADFRTTMGVVSDVGK